MAFFVRCVHLAHPSQISMCTLIDIDRLYNITSVLAYVIASLKGTECYRIRLVYRVQLYTDGERYVFFFFTIHMLVGEMSLKDCGGTFRAVFLYTPTSVRYVCVLRNFSGWFSYQDGLIMLHNRLFTHAWLCWNRLILSVAVIWGRNGRTAH